MGNLQKKIVGKATTGLTSLFHFLGVDLSTVPSTGRGQFRTRYRGYEDLLLHEAHEAYLKRVKERSMAGSPDAETVAVYQEIKRRLAPKYYRVPTSRFLEVQCCCGCEENFLVSTGARNAGHRYKNRKHAAVHQRRIRGRFVKK